MLEFTYARNLAATSDNVAFVVEWSDTLAGGSWSNAGVAEQVMGTGGNVQTVKASLPVGGSGKRFVHLRVTRPWPTGWLLPNRAVVADELRMTSAGVSVRQRRWREPVSGGSVSLNRR